MRFLCSVLVALGLTSAARLKVDPMKHSVASVTRSDFDAVISKFRDRQISAVFYYKPDDSDSSKFFESFNELASELRGMFKFAAVNCDDQPKLCKDEGADAADATLPLVVIYPMLPLSPFPLSRDALEKIADPKKGLRRRMIKLLSGDHVTTITEDKLESFLSQEEQIPKVIVFSEQKDPASLVKAISTEFNKEMLFGFFPSPSEEVLKKFKIKSTKDLPKIVMQESNHQGKRKVITYDGEFTYPALHEWVNLRRETFARGGGFDHTSASDNNNGPSKAPTRPWINQEFPEVYKQSHKDICFRFDEGLCVIYLTHGPLTDAQTELLRKAKSAKSGESVHFRFMWMDMEKEDGFKDLFNPDALPNVVVLNPHKRLRFTAPLEEPVTSPDQIANVIDKIVSGEGRFKMVPGQQLPAFTERKKEEAATEPETPSKEEL